MKKRKIVNRAITPLDGPYTMHFLQTFKRAQVRNWVLDRGEFELICGRQVYISRLSHIHYTPLHIPQSKLLNTVYPVSINFRELFEDNVNSVIVEWRNGEMLSLWGSIKIRPVDTDLFYKLLETDLLLN